MYVVDRWRYIELFCHALVKKCTSQCVGGWRIAGGGKTGLICVHSDATDRCSSIFLAICGAGGTTGGVITRLDCIITSIN